jgi:hypothetical protein
MVSAAHPRSLALHLFLGEPLVQDLVRVAVGPGALVAELDHHAREELTGGEGSPVATCEEEPSLDL